MFEQGKAGWLGNVGDRIDGQFPFSITNTRTYSPAGCVSGNVIQAIYISGGNISTRFINR